MSKSANSFSSWSGTGFQPVALLVLLLYFGGIWVTAQSATPPSPISQAAPVVDLSDPRLSRLPLDLREQGKSILEETQAGQRQKLAQALGRSEPAHALNFLLDVLSVDSSPLVRREIIERLGGLPHPQVRQALERHAASDPDSSVAILALEKLRVQQMQGMRHLLAQRIELARAAGDEADYRLLALEQQRWVSLVRGTLLPAFMQAPPPLFSVKPSGESIRVLAFGDFGNGGVEQRRVAEAMLRYHRGSPFDFAVTLGDNFYSKGMDSPDDARWKTWWDALYDPLGIPFYATLGNHDWGFADSPAAEVLYSSKSPSWRMPATRYTFTAGPVQFFALDTNGMSEAQLLWLRDELERSTARWKIVYGHHPIYSDGAHEDNVNMIDDLLPVLRDRADIYLAGHDHDMQHLAPEGRLHFFVAGGGGANIRPVNPEGRAIFKQSSYGFAVLEVDEDTLVVRFVDADLNQIYEYKVASRQLPVASK